MFHVIASRPDGHSASIARSPTREGAEEALRMVLGSVAMSGGARDAFTLSIEDRKEETIQ